MFIWSSIISDDIYDQADVVKNGWCHPETYRRYKHFAVHRFAAKQSPKKQTNKNDALSLGTLALFVVGDDLNGICHEMVRCRDDVIKVLIFD